MKGRNVLHSVGVLAVHKRLLDSQVLVPKS